MKKRLFGLAMGVATTAAILIHVREWLDRAQLPWVLLIALVTAIPVGLCCVWIYGLMEAYPRKKDVPHHEHEPKLWFEGMDMCYVCPVCGRRWSIRERYKVLQAVGVVIPLCLLGAACVSLSSDAFYYGENEAIAFAATLGVFIWGLCAVFILVNGALYLYLRRKEPKRNLGWDHG